MDLLLADRRPGDLVPGARHLGRSLALRAERVLALRLELHHLRVDERLAPPLERLVAVLRVEQVCFGGAVLLGTAPRILGEEPALLGEIEQVVGNREVALEEELRDGQVAGGPAGVSGNEGELALLRAARRPLEVVLAARRLAVLVGAQERYVQVVAREVEVVRIA